MLSKKRITSGIETIKSNFNNFLVIRKELNEKINTNYEFYHELERSAKKEHVKIKSRYRKFR